MADEIEQLFPRNGNYEIIQATDNIKFKTILDVGIGNGGASLYFSKQKKDVTAIGINIEQEVVNLFSNYNNINLINSTFEEYCEEKHFDAILMSHVLEHTQDVGSFLNKAYSLLNKEGWLFVMVPPYKKEVVGGHLSTGWNMGQLIYNLLLSGFNVKDGHYITYGHNICAFVQKRENKYLPPLNMDFGDISKLENFWPKELKMKEYTNGNIKSLNWFDNFDFSNEKYVSLDEVQKYEYLVSIYNFCNSLDSSKKYILFGYGSIGKLILPLIKKNISAIYDKSLNCSQIDDIQVISKEEINKYDNVIITAFKYKIEIIDELKSIGIPNIVSLPIS